MIRNGIVFIAAAFMLAACTTPMSTSETVGETEDVGVVIIGQAADGSGYVPLFNTCVKLSTFWVRTGAAKGESDVWLNKIGCPQDKANPVAYSLLKLKPGEYRLSHGAMQVGYATSTTRYAANPPKFTIAKGEVVYLGNLVFKGAFPNELVDMRRDDEKALATLKQYPGVKQEMVVRLFRY